MERIIGTALISLIAFISSGSAQNYRLHDDQSIGWIAFTGGIPISPKLDLYLEYQWRRTGAQYFNQWEQSLARVGFTYALLPGIKFRAGYGFIETFPYGEYPINSFGKVFPEHRIFESFILNHSQERFTFMHRYMLEQRFLGTYANATENRIDSYTFVNRLRYQGRIQMPIQGKTLDAKEFYLAAWDEIFIGFGKKVNANVFDQNRFAFLLGFAVRKDLKIEGGYFSQIIQLSRTIQQHPVFQQNSGMIFAVSFFPEGKQKQKTKQIQSG
ncbi:MAG: DUF2490 domain-containing protein [Sphingobacteriia bacterium]|nr:DUF2490 domain-containing protein [Sphingobacteriia bacterium]